MADLMIMLVTAIMWTVGAWRAHRRARARQLVRALDMWEQIVRSGVLVDIATSVVVDQTKQAMTMMVAALPAMRHAIERAIRWDVAILRLHALGGDLVQVRSSTPDREITVEDIEAAADAILRGDWPPIPPPRSCYCGWAGVGLHQHVLRMHGAVIA